MITIENRGKKIFLFGRNNKTPYIKEVKDFYPYFYVEDWRGKYKTVDDKQAKKIICATPFDIRNEREKYKETYEADVVYTNRYIIDKIDKIEKEEIRLCYLDIETEKTERGYGGPEKAFNPISSITCYDSFDKEYKMFYGKEKELLIEFISYIKEKDPDVLIAWNGDGFDFPFIINRMIKLNIEPKSLARMNGNVFTTEHGAKIFGRVLFDLMNAYKKHFSGGGRESWSLEYISNYELGEKGGKDKYKGELDDLRKNDFDKFLEYNKRDVELLVLINEKLKMIEFFDEIRRMAFCKFEDVFMNSKTADCLCLKHAKKNNFILPSVKKHLKGSYEGAFVHNSEPKLHRNIAVMDMKSLYPSVMIGFNISYETLSEDGEISVDNKYKFRKKKGIIPAIVKPLLDRRAEVKSQLKEVEYKSSEYRVLYMTQYALKVIANSFYGALGFRNFRLYKKEVAEAITYISRKIIKEVARWFEEKEFKIIYGDSVVGDTVIRVDNREMKIEDFWDMLSYSKLNIFKRKDKEIINIQDIKYKTLSLSDNNYNKKNTINKIIRHKCKKDLYEIETESGKKIVITEDHSLIIKRDGKKLIIKPEKLNLETDMVYTYTKNGNKKGCLSYSKGFKTRHNNKVNPKNHIRLKTYFKTHKNWAFEKTKENSEVIKRRSISVSKANKKYYKNNPEVKERIRQQRLKQQFPRQETKLEKWFEKNVMKKIGYNYEKQKIAEKYCKPDFIIKHKKIAIFCDGDFWHTNPKLYKNKKLSKVQKHNLEVDKRQNKYLKENGWTIIRLFESTIYSDKNLVKKLKEKIKCRQNWKK